jgi:hypothetical protein
MNKRDEPENTGQELTFVEIIQDRIFTIRGVQVMLDSNLAQLYGVELKRLNEQVKRNIERFPDSFCFQLTDMEINNLKSQFVTSREINILKSQFATSSWGGRRTMKYVFTKQRISMLNVLLLNKKKVKSDD